jgi:thiamine kinase-like enzyme
MGQWSSEQKDACLDAVVQRLASWHLDGRRLLAESSIPEAFSVSSAWQWVKAAFAEMQWLEQYGFSLTRIPRQELWEATAALYPHIEAWTLAAGPPVLIHGDPHLDNWVQSDEGDWRLIDWEYWSMAAPVRDLTILLQDVFGDEQQRALTATWLQIMVEGGWPVRSDVFGRALDAAFYDNTLMMLGHEISGFRAGRIAPKEFTTLWEIKQSWLATLLSRLVQYL